MCCRAETLGAIDEASPRPLAMAEERRKQEWGEAGGEGLRGTVPPAPLFIKGRGRGSAAPSQPIRPVEVTASWLVYRPPAPLKARGNRPMHAHNFSHPARLSFTLCRACSERGARDGCSGTHGAMVPK